MATAQILEDFQISSATGFLPQEPLLTRLPSHYEDWECICDHLHNLVKEKRIGEVLQDLKVLSTEQLTSYPDWRRAYVILGFLANGYLWGSEKPPNVCLQIPWEYDVTDSMIGTTSVHCRSLSPGLRAPLHPACGNLCGRESLELQID